MSGATGGTESDGPTGPAGELRARVLGEFRLEGADLHQIRSRKARATLKLLALGRGRPVSVDHLVDSLWPTPPQPARPARELSVNISRARAVVGRDRIERSDGGYCLHLDWLDLDRLEEIASEARRRLAAQDWVATQTLAAAGLALVTGPVLADEGDADWLVAERAAVSRTTADLRRLGAHAALAGGEPGQAASWAEQGLAEDPYDEEAARLVMSARLAAGRPGSALATYAELRRRLAEDLGAGPAAETEALYGQLLVASDPPATPAVGPRPIAGHAGHELVGSPVGRGEAMAALDRALAQVRAEGTLQVVALVGEAGAGKTFVLEAFAAQVRARGGQVLVGRADELGWALSLQPLSDALAGFLHLSGPDATGYLLADDLDLLAPLLGLGAAVPLPAMPGPGMDTPSMEAHVFGALLRTLGRVAEPVPTVLVVDDLHLAEPSTLAWLRFALRRRAEAPLLVVVAQRPGPVPALADATIFELGPLDLEAAVQLVGAERAALLLERSGGNPLLLTELAAHPDAALPGTVREAVTAEVAAAGTEVATTVRAAAVLGPEVDLDLLAHALDRSALELLDHLEQATERRLLAERGGRLVFRHALVREALVADTSSARRALVHARAVARLAERPDPDSLAVAYHAELAGDRVAAATALARAADGAAFGRHDLAEAERLVSRAIELCDGPELRLQRGRLRLARRDVEGAEADAEQAAAAGHQAESLALRAWAARLRRDTEAALRFGRLGAAAATDPTTRASSLIAESLAHRALGDLPAAEDCLARAETAHAPDELGVSGWLGMLRVHQGRVDEALDLLEPALGAEIDTVHGFWVEHVLQMAVHAQALRGRPARALALIDRWREEMERRGSLVRYRGSDANYRAWILDRLGQPEAADVAEEALAQAGLPEITAQAHLDAADRRTLMGDADGARRDLARADAAWTGAPGSNQWRCLERGELVRVRLALDGGDPADAFERVDRLVARAEARGERRYATLGRLLAARASHRLGRPVDHATVAADLDDLAGLAGLDAWWLTAETAADLGVDAWWAKAEGHAAALAGQAGDRADSFRAHATRRLDQLRVNGTAP